MSLVILSCRVSAQIKEAEIISALDVQNMQVTANNPEVHVSGNVVIFSETDYNAKNNIGTISGYTSNKICATSKKVQKKKISFPTTKVSEKAYSLKKFKNETKQKFLPLSDKQEKFFNSLFGTTVAAVVNNDGNKKLNNDASKCYEFTLAKNIGLFSKSYNTKTQHFFKSGDFLKFIWGRPPPSFS